MHPSQGHNQPQPYPLGGMAQDQVNPQLPAPQGHGAVRRHPQHQQIQQLRHQGAIGPPNTQGLLEHSRYRHHHHYHLSHQGEPVKAAKAGKAKSKDFLPM